MNLYDRTNFEYKIKEMIKDLKKIYSKLENDVDKQNIKRIENKIVKEIEWKTNIILREMYSELRDNLFEISPFKDNFKNQNLFDDLDLRVKILNECKFKLNHTLNLEIKSNIKNISTAIGTGGVILAVIQGSIVPLSLVIASILLYKANKSKNENEIKRNVRLFFDNLEKDFKNWLNDIESYFKKEVKKGFPDIIF